MASNITGPRGYVVGVDEIPEKEPFQADIIQLGGTVHGSKGRGYLNYLPLGGGTPGQAWNMARIQERPDVAIWIGYFQNEPVIMSLDKSRMEPNGARGYRSPLFAQHALDHGWSSGDPLYVDSRQIKELMVRPAGEFKVNISPGRYGNGLGYAYFAGQQNYDLAAYQPAVAGTKRKIGLYLDSAGALQVVAGGLLAVTAVIPELDWPAGVFRLISFILFESKDFIDFEYVKQEKALYVSPFSKATALYTPGGTLAWSVNSAGDLTTEGGVLDLNGVVDGLVLDADADTSLSSPTDDQIDVEVGGADRARFTSTSLLLLTPTVIDLDGITDALVLDADADTSISSPTDDQIDFEAGGVDIARIDASGLTLPQAGDDIYIGGDEAGVRQRQTGLWSVTVEDDFIGSALDGAWAWAGAPFVTPSGQSWAVNSTLLVGHNVANQRMFLARTDNLTNISHYVTAIPNILADDAYFGFRFDDGSDNNYVESVIRKTNAVATLEVVSRVRTGGGAVTVTVRQTVYDYPAIMSIGLTTGGTQWTSWTGVIRFSKSGPATAGVTMASGLTWTPTRRGITIFNANTTGATSGPFIDKEITF